METIRKGSRGASVKKLQQRLNLIADGIFGSITEEAVIEFQKRQGLVADGIVGTKTWDALGGSKTNTRFINKIIIHCSATPEGEDYTVDQIRGIHLERGFTDIGYHWYITRDGKIHKGRDESKVGAHTKGQNANSIGVCYCGGCPPRSISGWNRMGKDTRTQAQREAIIKLCKDLKHRYPNSTIHGHNEFAAKACPSFNVQTDPDLRRL